MSASSSTGATATGGGGGASEASSSRGGTAGGGTGTSGNYMNGGTTTAGTGIGEPSTATTSGSRTGTTGRRKTNVCLICGIYTNLALNIFEQRNGPNIIDVIYEKYKFRAERGDNGDKHICFSCNNWLINWYSLQNSSESKNYEPTPSSSRSSDNNRHKRTKNSRGTNDKENVDGEQDHHVSSTTGTATPESEKKTKKRKSVEASERRVCNRRLALREANGQQQQHRHHHQEEISSTSSHDARHLLVKPFESQLIRMLESQGTSVYKENASPVSPGSDGGSSNIRRILLSQRRCNTTGHQQQEATTDGSSGNEILLSFDSALSEIVEVVPSLKDMQIAAQPTDRDSDGLNGNARFLNHRRLSGSLSISLIDGTLDQ